MIVTLSQILISESLTTTPGITEWLIEHKTLLGSSQTVVQLVDEDAFHMRPQLTDRSEVHGRQQTGPDDNKWYFVT